MTKPKHSLLELVGILNKKEVRRLEESIKDLRKASRKRSEKIAKEMNRN